jgi:hypothetical protein
VADSEEMRRLMLHAADRLAQEGHGKRIIEAIAEEVFVDRKRGLARELQSQTAAMALAESVLRMVAACMGVEEPAQKQSLTRGTDGRFRKTAPEGADERNGHEHG